MINLSLLMLLVANMSNLKLGARFLIMQKDNDPINTFLTTQDVFTPKDWSIVMALLILIKSLRKKESV